MSTGSSNILKTYGQDGKAFDKKEYRKIASKRISMANKRLRRLEKNDLTDSPAYQALVKNGKPQFSVKGKSFNELQQEVSRLEKFLNSETSTVRGVSSVLKGMASSTGIKYKNMTDLKEKSTQFFRLYGKVEEYLRLVDDAGSAFDYQEIWEAINTYIKDTSLDLSAMGEDIDVITEAVTDIIKNAPNKRLEDYQMSNDWVFLS